MEFGKMNRRTFTGRAIFIGASLVLAPVTAWRVFKKPDGSIVLNSTTTSTVFNPAERTMLAAMSEAIFPGASGLGAVEYIENLFTAFDSDPPRIFAGGPFSGRQPFSRDGVVTNEFPENSFTQFVPLTRHQEAAWKYKIFGSKGLTNGGPNDSIVGPKKGWREVITYGLDQAITISPKPVQKLTVGDAADIMGRAPDKNFRDLLTQLVLEGCFAAPEYGGNKGLAGWQLVHFEGDSQPLGYSMYNEKTGDYIERPEAPLSRTDLPGDSGDYKLSARVKLLLFAIVQARRVHIGK